MVSQDDLIATLALSISSASLLTVYIVVSIAMYTIYKESKNPFYLLLFAMGISDMSTLALFLCYSAPCTFLQTYLLGDVFDALAGGTVCNISYFSSLWFLMNIAINRYVAICHPKLAAKMQSQRTILLSIAGSFGLGFVCSIAQFTPCCSMRYYPDNYSWTYDTKLDGNSKFVWFDRFMSGLTFVCLVTCYGLMFRKVRKVTAEVQPAFQKANTSDAAKNQRTNLKLAIQSAIISSFYITLDFAFTVIPLLTENKWWLLVISLWNICAIGVHPFIYLACNDTVRRQVMSVFRCKVAVEDGTLGPASISHRSAGC